MTNDASTTPAPPRPPARDGSDDHVLVVGEALVDVVHRADGGIDEHPGGSPANVALTLGRLGREVRLATWLADDARGEAIRAWLDASSVTLTRGSDGAGSTSVAAARLDLLGAATYDFDLQWHLPAGTTAGHHALALHTGSIAAMLDPGASDVHALARASRSTATISYDPNVRPALMGDPARARARIEALVALADVVKVSDEDIGWLVPGSDPADVARRWLALGPALVVVTLGGDGAFAVTAEGEQHVTAPRVQVVDTVGAGDSFTGALLDGLWGAGLLGAERRAALRRIDAGTLTAILQHCVAVAAVTVSRAGANPPRRAELPVG